MAGNAQGIRAGRAFIELFAEDSKLRAGLKAAEARFRAFGTSVRAIGQSMMMAGVAVATPMAAASKVFADFESAMARVKALTGASGEEFSSLSDLAKKLGADTIFSAAQAAQAMGNFAQAGLSVKEIMQAVGPALDLAATAQIEIADAASIATKIMRGMGIAAGDLGGVVDVLAKASTTANTDIMMLGDAFKFVGPVAKTAGVSLEEIAAAIQLLSNAGIQGEMAGTTLRGMILALLAPSQEADDALRALGIRTLNARGEFVGLTSILAQLKKSMAGMGSGQQLGILGTIFSDRQAAGAAELMAQGAERLAGATRALGGSAGTAARVAGIQMDTLRGTIDVLMSSIEGVGIEIGQVLSPILRALGGILADAANWVAAFVRDNKQFTIIAAGLAVGLVAAGGALISLGVASSLAGSALALISASMGLVSAVAGTLASAVAALLTPIGLITAALVAGGAAWFAYSESGQAALAWLGEQFGALYATATDTFKGIADAMMAGDLALAGQVLWAGLEVAWLQGTNALMGIWRDWSTAAIEVVRSLQFGVAGVMIDLWASIESIWASGMANLSGSWQTVLSNLVQPLIPFKDIVAQVFGVDVGKAIDDALGVNPEDRARQQADLAAEQARIEANRQGARAVLGQDQQTEVDARRNANAQADASALAELEKAKADLAALTGQADNLRRVKDASTPGGGKPGAADMPSLDPAELDAALSQAKAKIDVAGSFSAAAFKGLGVGDSIGSDQLKEQQKATKELQTLNRKVDKAKLVLTD